MTDDFIIFAGTANPELAASVERGVGCAALGRRDSMLSGRRIVGRFASSEFVRKGGTNGMFEKHISVTLPELALVAATRGAIGVGAGLLLADKLQPKRRKAIGRLLFVAGVLSTIPIALRLFGKER
jgi:hypothetical protein